MNKGFSDIFRPSIQMNQMGEGLVGSIQIWSDIAAFVVASDDVFSVCRNVDYVLPYPSLSADRKHIFPIELLTALYNSNRNI